MKKIILLITNYKIYFKDEKFPFRLVITKTMWSRDELIP